MSKFSVSIVIPNWNGVDKLRKNLPSVLNIKGVLEVIVSDDASTDESIQLLEEKFPKVVIVRRSINGGFASNVNSGVKVAQGELIFLLNTDATPYWLCQNHPLFHLAHDQLPPTLQPTLKTF